MPKYEIFKRKLNSKQYNSPTTGILLSVPSGIPVEMVNYVVLSPHLNPSN
jgi:hypothetical protein